ncbi:MAG: hypothetical protein HQM08_14775 [Candidatus Riflebacteria bacterium]|nr:hypothetical protein [Candidatus Riflebacteria bacterium]
MIKNLVVTSKEQKKEIFLSGIILFFIFFTPLFFIGCGEKQEDFGQVETASDTKNLISIESVSDLSDPKNIFEKFQLPKLHNEYQKSYMDLIDKINALDYSKGIDVKQQKEIFKNYSQSFRKYQDAILKISHEQKEMKQRCFSVMKSLVLAVVFYDKKMNKKLFKFDSKRLIEAGILKEEPICPANGEYSIFYKDGKRFLRCSVHGTLKQK